MRALPTQSQTFRASLESPKNLLCLFKARSKQSRQLSLRQNPAFSTATLPIPTRNPTRRAPPTSPPATSRPFYISHTAVTLPPTLSAMDGTYTFPNTKTWTLKDPTKTPLVLISCGSFSPITYLHLRMFEMCKDWVKENTAFEVVAGYLSPVADAYKKEGLAKAVHRVEMCRRASHESSWIMVDDWEAGMAEYTRTALVLDHFEHEINEVRGGISTPSGDKRKAKISLMSGADLIQTMSNPGVWAEEDLEHILGRYGAFIIERHGTDIEQAMATLQKWRHQVWTIPQLIQNDVSSTKIRTFLQKDMSIR